ncbi:hypothetical protein CXF78_15805, partial [Shewanella sp. 11B5]
MNKLYSRKPLVTAVAIAIPLMLSTASVNSAEFDIADTKVTVGGYDKLMVNYDTDGTITAPFNGDLYSVYTTPIDGSANAEKSDLHMTARESRLF